jgi:hypothetical protein
VSDAPISNQAVARRRKQRLFEVLVVVTKQSSIAANVFNPALHHGFYRAAVDALVAMPTSIQNETEKETECV